MKRLILSAFAVVGLVLASLAFTPAAQAITNPADNPHPITVKGDDGQTYTDGADTLPGYDDEECTYIPGAYFDFDNNRVRYADGQSIPWTEWDRATGYKQWLANKDKPSSTPTKKPTSTPTKKPTTNSGSTGTKPKSSTGGTGSTGGDGDNKAATTTDTATDGVTPADGATPADGSTPAKGAKAQTGAAQAAPTDSAVTGETDEVTLASGASDLNDVKSTDSSGSGSAGLLILGALGVVGLLFLGGYTAFGRKSRKEPTA